MSSLARWCFNNRRVVLVVWLAALIGFIGVSRAVGSKTKNDFRLPNTDSQAAYNLLKASFPAQSGDTEQVVLAARTGTLRDPAVAARAESMLSRIAVLPHVRAVASPYRGGGRMNPDGTVALATVVLDGQPQDVPAAAVRALISTAQAADSSALEVQLGGQAVEQAQHSGGGGNSSEIVGIFLALAVLYIAFGAFLAALMPLLAALIAIGIGTSLITLLTHVFTIASFADQLSVLIGLGVGVDYALFIITRHRAGLIEGRGIEESAAVSVNTSGRAVFFAGLVVCIALLGQFALSVSFLYGVALSAAFTVLLTMMTALTLLPAMLGFLGVRVLSRRERRRLLASGPRREASSGFWFRWSHLVARRYKALGAAALAAVVVLGVPILTLRLGLSDAGNDSPSTTTRQAYDLLAKGFGPGFNGPFTVVGALNAPGDQARFAAVMSAISRQPGIVATTPTRLSPSGAVAIATAVPSTAPQAAATAALVNRLRDHVIPAVEGGSGLVVHVGGSTAGTIDFAHVLARKIPLFIGVVVVLAFLLLMLVFRSILVPLVASIMNLLSVGAAFGVMNAVFEWGWGAGLLGIDRKGPVDVFVPVILFSILFGLSMDYEVFLVSRIHEEWMRRADNQEAVTVGQAATGRVITAAATIMILIFGSFLLLGERVIKEFGLGLAAAILVDAFIIRTALVPAVMHRLGRANWWLPGPLERLLPHVAIDPDEGPMGRPEPVGSASD
ncbi:MMPL family transporter [Acidiferrimicrobium sp. IK]|uniref:MMPL family transporter n=1 Tax=Acidiferrimicrobium sp. IK TaxID=2871700 RepID=UPI0021CB50B1|nr:MMPL family transporter [Acidiferrimicrobium sp. IK]MCU4184522.1 MMPL family transporter [Acidiferrimicrobium sp. IK]